MSLCVGESVDPSIFNVSKLGGNDVSQFWNLFDAVARAFGMYYVFLNQYICFSMNCM